MLSILGGATGCHLRTSWPHCCRARAHPTRSLAHCAGPVAALWTPAPLSDVVGYIVGLLSLVAPAVEFIKWALEMGADGLGDWETGQDNLIFKTARVETELS